MFKMDSRSRLCLFPRYTDQRQRNVVVDPHLFVSDVGDKELLDHYEFKYKIQTQSPNRKYSGFLLYLLSNLSFSESRSSCGLPFYEKVAIRHGGFKASGPILGSSDVEHVVGRDGSLTLDLTVRLMTYF